MCIYYRLWLMIRETKLSKAQLGSYVLQCLSYPTHPFSPCIHKDSLSLTHTHTHTHILSHEHTYSKMSNVLSSPIKFKHPSLAIRYLMIKSHCFLPTSFPPFSVILHPKWSLVHPIQAFLGQCHWWEYHLLSNCQSLIQMPQGPWCSQDSCCKGSLSYQSS